MLGNFRYEKSLFHIATHEVLEEKQFDIAKILKECEVEMEFGAGKPEEYEKELRKGTYRQLKKMVLLDQLDMVHFYIEKGRKLNADFLDMANQSKDEIVSEYIR